MIFYNPNLTMLENFNTNAKYVLWLSLIIVCVALTGLIRYRRDSEKRKEYAPLFTAGSFSIIIVFLYFTLIRPMTTESSIKVTSAETNKSKQYESLTTKENCRLCGEDNKDILSWYFGEKNVGIISLNTFDFSIVEINRYDDKKNLIQNKATSYCMTNRTFQSGEKVFSRVDSDRGYADVKMTINEGSHLSLSNLESFLCSDCLTDTMNNYFYSGEHLGIGLINFENRKIRPFEECLSGFSNGDFRVWCDYKEDGDIIDLIIVYCPVRYDK